MRDKQLTADDQAERTWALILEPGEDPVSCIESFASDHRLSAAHLTAIGAFAHVTLGWFDWDAKDYREIVLDEQLEVLSLVGDIALKDGEPSLHAHVVVGSRDGNARGGHLLGARVRPTLEVILTEAPAHLRKRHDPESGLALISAA